MSWWEALILGLVQGASEFLPISSSGHLLLLEKLGVGEENLFFNILLHIGTLLAVLIVLRKQWLPLLRHPLQKKTLYLFVACVPTIALAIAFKYLCPTLLSGSYLALGFMTTACLIVASEKLSSTKPQLNNIKTSILTGISQGIAVLPGISRSGATIATMRLLGVEKEEATNFSFLLSIPIIIGSALFEGLSLLLKGAGLTDSATMSTGVADTANSIFVASNTANAISTTATTAFGIDVFPLILGVFAAFISGLLAIKFFLKLIKNRSLLGFAIYDMLMAVATLAVLGCQG
ncbi:MAG: undecaprenyl-diphosphate phosphatase [Clostridia bacterium]